MSCADCHLPEHGFADARPQAVGAGGRILARNTPTLWNVAYYPALMWDGRVSGLESQAFKPIESPLEMDQDLAELEREVAGDTTYAEQFQAAYGTGVTRQGIARALAAYQRTLIGGDSPLDRYLRGDEEALTEQARRGLELFVGEAGCVRCHNGALLSDGKFYRLGVSFHDPGRQAVTGLESDRYKFRTPTLRNVALTAPYMHDGSLESLDEVVMFYFRDVPSATPEGEPLDIHPLQGQSFSDMAAMVAFLRSLTGVTAHE